MAKQKKYLASHRPPKKFYRHSSVAQASAETMKARGREQGEKGQSRLREMARRRKGMPWGRHDIGYLQYGLGQAYISRATTPRVGILSQALPQEQAPGLAFSSPGAGPGAIFYLYIKKLVIIQIGEDLQTLYESALTRSVICRSFSVNPEP